MKIRSVGHSLKLERPHLHFPDNVQFPIWVIIKNSPAAGLHVDSWRPHLVSYRGPNGFMEELYADDRQQADAHRQDDG